MARCSAFPEALAVCPALSSWQLLGAYAGLRPALDPERFGSDYLMPLAASPTKKGTDMRGDRIYMSYKSILANKLTYIYI